MYLPDIYNCFLPVSSESSEALDRPSLSTVVSIFYQTANKRWWCHQSTLKTCMKVCPAWLILLLQNMKVESLEAALKFRKKI